MLELSLTILIWLIIIIIASSILIYVLTFSIPLLLMVVAKIKGDKAFNDFSKQVEQEQKEFEERAEKYMQERKNSKLLNHVNKELDKHFVDKDR
jgi:cell shape-determining protein MreC